MEIFHYDPTFFSEERTPEEQEEVKIKSEVEMSLNEILRDVEWKDVCSIWEGIVDNINEDVDVEPAYDCCYNCKSLSYEVEGRVDQLYESPPDILIPIDNERHICMSCKYGGRKCGFCGISEKLVKVKCDRSVVFFEKEQCLRTDGSNNYYTELYCPECYSITGENDVEPSIDICNFCGGNHETEDCPTNLWDVYHNEYEIDTVGDSSLLDKEETEEVKDIKKDFKELMDLSFEFKENISSGEFVTMMDKMKKMYDKL